MKLLIILVAVLLSVDGREVPDQVQDRESSIQQQESEEEIISDDWSSILERSVCDKPTISCTLAGGSCISSGEDCGGTVDPKGCKGRQCECCIPPKEECRGCPEGYFYYPASDQCFKSFDNALRYPEAEAKCAEDGGIVAHPYDLIGLRDYIVTRFGSPRKLYAWLGGQQPANSTTVRWNDNGAIVDNDNPMWYGEPKALPWDQCLLLMVNSHSWAIRPNRPLYRVSCTNPQATICEFVRE